MLRAKSGTVAIGPTEMEYICFGRGEKNLILLPGLGDALKTVKGSGALLAMMYRPFASGFRVYVFSRKNELEPDCSIQSMADDQAVAMRALGLESAAVVGVSQGGMIAQQLALRHPQLVEKLVLAVSVAGQTDTLRETVTRWVALAKEGDYRSLFIDTAEHTYSEPYLKKYRPIYPVLCRIGRPKSLKRFLLQAAACLGHESGAALADIACPTLVIGGDDDRVVGKTASADLARAIPGSRLVLYRGLGHGAYEEAKDFNKQVLDFLNE